MPSRRRTGLIAILAAALLFLSGAQPVPVRAAAPAALAQLRVALFINSAKYKALTAQVTVSNSQGLRLEPAGASGTEPWITTGSQPVEISLDSYGIEWLRTADLPAAAALSERLASAGEQPEVYRRSLGGKTVYDVVTGPYGSQAAAEAAMARLSGGVAGLLGGGRPAVTGPLHLSAGTYDTEAAARQRQAELAQAGIAADLAVVGQAGLPAYAVWTASAPDAAGLAALQRDARQKLPQLALEPADPAGPYLVERDEVAAGGQGGLPHYFLGAAGAKWTIAPVDPAAGIALKEKSGRIYRGSLEIGSYNGAMSVVNIVDLQAYLYSVVSKEMGGGWPPEALKAQAVAARTFALRQGLKYGIAHVSDSTLDQVYTGMAEEAPDCVKAVDATKGLVLVSADGSLIEPVFSSNAGGMTADPSEVWGNPVPYLKSVKSPDDDVPAAAAPASTGPASSGWVHVQLPDGRTGYVSADYLKATGDRNAAGRLYYEPTGTSVNVRPRPSTGSDSVPIGQVNPGDRLLALDTQVAAGEGGSRSASTPYSWIRGPYTADQLLKMINSSLDRPIAGPLVSLEVTGRGPSGRVTEIKANGQPLKVAYPDAFRSLFGGLPSTLFEIEHGGSYTILGAGRSSRSLSGGKLSVLSGKGPSEVSAAGLSVLSADGQTRTLQPGTGEYFFRGRGSGHGLGMSQWGARSLAESGYGFEQILQYYYSGVNLVKVD